MVITEVQKWPFAFTCAMAASTLSNIGIFGATKIPYWSLNALPAITSDLVATSTIHKDIGIVPTNVKALGFVSKMCNPYISKVLKSELINYFALGI